ncbi:MAG: hypothetical protein PHE36_01750 [Novosphingobium sp.]|nr:hypothetical protein [Novosphingobium sp.]
MTITLSRKATLLGAALFAAACPAFAIAQDTPEAPDMSDPAVQQRIEANRQQAETAQAQLDANAASQKAHDDAVQEREQVLSQQEAATAKAKADYDAAMARWKETVEACKRGDTARCKGD